MQPESSANVSKAQKRGTVKTSLNLKSQALALLLLVLCWLGASLYVSVQSAYYPLYCLSVALPLPLLILGVTFALCEACQRFRHPYLFYGTAIASALPTIVGVLRFYLFAYSSK